MAFLPAIPAALSALFAFGSTAAAGTAASTAAASSAIAAGGAAAAGSTIEAASIPIASSLAGTVANIGTGLALAGGAVGAYGALKSASAQANAAKYNAAIDSENANVARQNAAIAGQSGAEQAGMTSLKGRAVAGEMRANQAAGNIDVNSGSPVDVQMSQRELSEIDALTVRSNATRQAYGYQTQAESQQAEAGLQTYEAGQDITAGGIGAASTFLGGVSSAASKYTAFQLQSGLGNA